MHNVLADPWSDQQLLRTVGNYAGTGADADQPESVRFLRGVAQLVIKRLRSTTEVSAAPAVFLLCPVEPENVDRTLLKSHPMLDNGLTPVEGRLWLVSHVVTAGKSIPLDFDEDCELFDLVNSTLKQGHVPAVIYDPRVDSAQIRYYSVGLQDADACEIIDIPTTERIDLGRILAVIDRVCEKQLITPDAQSQAGKLWQDSHRHWVASNAEVTVQLYLVTALFAAFPTCVVRFEQSQVTGRLDVEIEEPDHARPGHIIRHAVLELKVLRSFGSTGTPVSSSDVLAWLIKGVDQAYAYREEKGALQSALCCFDMRRLTSDVLALTEVAEKSLSLEVLVRSWPLFASAEAYRSFLAQGSVK